MKACDDCGHIGELERSASGQMYCADMVACLERPAVARDVPVSCSFCAHKDGLVQDGWRWRWRCADGAACSARVTKRLHKRKAKVDSHKRSKTPKFSGF